jgi:hypothetical protein
MPKSKFEAKLIEFAGPRCPEAVEGCAVCDAWRLYDLSEWGKLLALFIDDEVFWQDCTKNEARRRIASMLWNQIEDQRIEQTIEASKLGGKDNVQ